MSSKAPSDGVRERILRRTIQYPPVTNETGKIINDGFEGIITGRQKTVSISHAKDRNGRYVDGGPFYTSRTMPPSGDGTHVSLGPIPGSSTKRFYSGPIRAPIPSGATADRNAFMKALGSEDTSALEPQGATAISLCAPTNSAASLSTGLSELVREGSPSLPGIRTWKKRTELAKAAGDEYLNAVFGWLPLTKEVKEVSSSVSHASQIAKQYERDEGKNVRRRFDFDTETSESSPKIIGTGRARVGNGGSSYWNDPKIPLGNIYESSSLTRNVWFSGCFTYALPSKSDSFERLHRQGALANHVVGLDLTPTVLWELTPWSWAIDWFSNTGDVINNVTNFGQYGLVMRYGYIMSHTIETFSHWMDRAALVGAEDTPVAPSILVRETKVRVPANPFGFGIGWEGLSPTQLAITAALGITRL